MAGFVLGPALDADIGTSLQALAMLLKGAYPAVPPVDFPVVDVRDLAAVHVAAMAPAAGGRRLIATRETWSMSRMGQEMRAAHPDRARKIPVGVLPAPVVRLMSVFDASLRTLRADLGVRPTGDSAETTRLTGVTFRSKALPLFNATDVVVGAVPLLIACCMPEASCVTVIISGDLAAVGVPVAVTTSG
jgi:dihydroflavonol-4-reductase